MPAMLRKIAMNSIVTTYLISSLVLAKFSTLSVLKANEHTEPTPRKNYAFCVMFMGFWIASMLVILAAVIVLYLVWVVKLNGGKMNLMKEVAGFFGTVLAYFSPKAYVGAWMMVALVVLNLCVMFYYLATKDTDTIIFDKNEENENLPDAEDTGVGGAAILENDAIENDKDGVGFVYRLVEYAYKMDLCILIFTVWIIDGLRMCT